MEFPLPCFSILRKNLVFFKPIDISKGNSTLLNVSRIFNNDDNRYKCSCETLQKAVYTEGRLSKLIDYRNKKIIIYLYDKSKISSKIEKFIGSKEIDRTNLYEYSSEGVLNKILVFHGDDHSQTQYFYYDLNRENLLKRTIIYHKTQKKIFTKYKYEANGRLSEENHTLNSVNQLSQEIQTFEYNDIDLSIIKYHNFTHKRSRNINAGITVNRYDYILLHNDDTPIIKSIDRIDLDGYMSTTTYIYRNTILKTVILKSKLSGYKVRLQNDFIEMPM